MMMPFWVDLTSYPWHEMNSLPFTQVISFVACQTTSKILEIGSSERASRNVKAIKNWKHASIGSVSLEKRVILSMSAKLVEVQLLRSLDLSKDCDHDVFG